MCTGFCVNQVFCFSGINAQEAIMMSYGNGMSTSIYKRLPVLVFYCYWKLSALKQYKLFSYSFGDQKSEMNLTESAGLIPSGCSRGESISCLPQL